MFDLTHKVAVITGGAAGIGRAAARMFAMHGASVAIFDIDPAADAVAQEITQAGGRVLFARVDVTNDDSIRAGVDATLAAFGKIDILYNNAGGSRPGDGSLLDVGIDALVGALSVDLSGTWLCCRQVIPEIAKAGGGAIVNTSSLAGLMGYPGLDGYSSAKGAVSSLTRALAVKLAPMNIRVNAIAPGLTLTERLTRKVEAGVLPQADDRHLLGYLQPDQIASAALFLASDAASGITGQVLPVDSGLSIS